MKPFASKYKCFVICSFFNHTDKDEFKNGLKHKSAIWIL